MFPGPPPRKSSGTLQGKRHICADLVSILALHPQGCGDGEAKGWQVVGLTGGDELAVHHHFLIDVVSAGVDQGVSSTEKKEVTVLPLMMRADPSIQGP